MMKHIKLDDFIKKSVLELTPYKVNDAPSPGVLKLDANESNYRLTRKMRGRYADFIKSTLINLYPNSKSANLAVLLERHYGISPENFIFGNGSDELISIILLSLKKDVTVNIPVPSFSMYGIIASYNELKVNYIGLDEKDFDLPEDMDLDFPEENRDAPPLENRNTIDNLIENSRKNDNISEGSRKNIFFFSYPNNPTGNHFNSAIIKRLIENKNNIVVVDEAYIYFSDKESFVKYILDYDNLIVLRTFSKIGLAGLRFGMLFAGDKLINEFKKIKLPFNINSLTLSSIEFFLDNFDEFEKNIKKTVSERKRLYSALKKINMLETFKSDANFIFIKLKNRAIKPDFERYLNDNNILIRGFDEDMDLFYRITVGMPSENKKIINHLNLFFLNVYEKI